MEQAASLRLKNIRLTGAVSYREAMNYVAGMDVCLLPFRHGAVSDGSCPLKLFEYAALRKPIVSTSIQEVRKIGKGWVEFADDEGSFSEAIDSFLIDRRASARVSEKGRALVERIYNWPNLTRQFEELLIKGAVAKAETARVHPPVMESLTRTASISDDGILPSPPAR
jgi:hypothetical protein